jgi:hypothetical protein
MKEILMQDLFENYVDDLNKLRNAFHNELAATAEELRKGMDTYAERSEAALASFMEKVSARGLELEASAARRLDQFRGVSANGGLPNIDDGSQAHAPTSADQSRIAAAAEGAIADGLHVEKEGDREKDGDRKPWPGRQMTLVKSEPAA